MKAGWTLDFPGPLGEETLVKKILVVAGGMVAAALYSAPLIANADPIDGKLAIDGKELVSKVAAPKGHPFKEVLSGWLFRTAETRAMESESFNNAGMLTVQDGAALWNKVEGTAGKSCASCHNDAAKTMKGVGAHYPKWDQASGKPINIELQINNCRKNQMGAEPYEFDKPGQKALTTFIRHQSLGEAVAIDLSKGDMQKWWEKGKEVYYTRTGQLNLSCANCHEDSLGKMIRADHLSQGQSNGFPTYRLGDGLVSIHGRFRGCIRDTRAVIPKAFSDELMALEVYVAWRGTGLAVETPAVRQ